MADQPDEPSEEKPLDPAFEAELIRRIGERVAMDVDAFMEGGEQD